MLNKVRSKVASFDYLKINSNEHIHIPKEKVSCFVIILGLFLKLYMIIFAITKGMSILNNEKPYLRS